MILVTGAAGYSGRLLVSRLVADRHPVRCLVRSEGQRALFEAMEVDIWVGDLRQAASVRGGFAGVDRIVHLAGIELAPTLIDCISRELKRVVLLSSLRRFSKVPSTTVARVIAGEEEVAASGMPYTILQSSMIFGPGNDRNISRLAAYLRRHRIMPIFGDGSGLQQPILVSDVVEIATTALFSSLASGRAYPIAGAAPLSYNRLVDLVGAAVGTKPLKIHLPAKSAAGVLGIAERIGLRLAVDREQVLRLQEDKSVSIAAAQRDLGFAPLHFEEALHKVYSVDKEVPR